MLKECCFCGAPFETERGYKKMCPECEDIISHNRGRKCARIYAGPVNVSAYEWNMRRRNIEEHKDTIIAEGYADRQKAKTLSTVSKIKTTL